MHLTSFSVQNYRSITKAHKIKIGRSTILIGPNNEGKSNLLRAMVTALRVLSTPRERLMIRRLYDWERDFPVRLQNVKTNGESVFTLEFELTDDDVVAFRSEVASKITGTLPIQVSIGPKGHSIKVVKKGPGASVLSQKREQIAKFVAARLDIQYVPAVRTAESSLEVVETLLGRELERLEGDEKYQKAVAAVEALQQPVLDALALSVRQTLQNFLPDVANVGIRIPSAERLRALRRAPEISIDDGTKTLLQHKGDGVQSLSALALMRHLSESGALGRNLVIAIEEPEAHLHPNAIHQVRGVLRELAAKHRLVIATHCPLFVDRADVANNILVSGNRARPAKTVAELREILGVRASDNLRHAELVLLVEGEDDRLALFALFRAASESLRDALDNGTIVIEPVGGASNFVYKAGLVRDSLCEVHLFLDADEAGRDAAELLREQRLAVDSEMNFATCLGSNESELEDLYAVSVYSVQVYREFGVRIDVPSFRGNRKWSVRARETFVRQGKLWDERVSMRLKAIVAEAVAGSPQSALEAGRRNSFDALVLALNARMAASTDVAG